LQSPPLMLAAKIFGIQNGAELTEVQTIAAGTAFSGSINTALCDCDLCYTGAVEKHLLTYLLTYLLNKTRRCLLIGRPIAGFAASRWIDVLTHRLSTKLAVTKKACGIFVYSCFVHPSVGLIFRRRTGTYKPVMSE